MGPNPLIYPQNCQSDEDATTRTSFRDLQQTVGQQQQQQSSVSGSIDSGLETASSGSILISNNLSTEKSSRSIPHFDRLFSASNETNGE